MIAIALLLAASPMSAALDAYGDCVVRTAVAWAGGPDAADVIVASADFHCGAEREKARQALPDGPGAQRLFDAFVAGTRAKAQAAIVERRAKR